VGKKQLNILVVAILVIACSGASNAGRRPSDGSATPTPEEQKFLAVPNPATEEQNMKVLTAEPHVAGTPEDWKTAQFVAEKFREAGLETSIVPYKVWLNYPKQVNVDIVYPARIARKGPTPEHVEGDRFENDPRVLPAFNGYSPSGEVTADIVYANYGRPEDFKLLKDRGIDVRGKIVLVRYGENFRGVKTYLAQEAGAAGVILYSDPMDDGYTKGKSYPNGPWRPDTGVQRGTVEFGFEHPGDPTTPGYAGTLDLPDSKRINPEDNPDMPKIPTTPISAYDAAPMLQNLGGPECPRDWQGALPFTYHMGPGPVRVHLNLKQDYEYRTIWNVIGKIRGTEFPDELVIAGNHRDAWVFGAVDPISGTVAMLDAIRGLGELMKDGWRPKRTIIFASWDGEEQGLIGSTEWVEQNEGSLGKAVAYFNTDTGAAGPNFRAAATPSLKSFLRDISKIVPDPQGGTLFDQWRMWGKMGAVAAGGSDVSVGNLGSGSDYTSFVDHLGVPSSDIRTTGNYGVYHSVFDNFEWYCKFGDPGFHYSQMISRVFGLEVMRMADATVLPYDYENYGAEILDYVEQAEQRAQEVFGEGAPDFIPLLHAARRFRNAGRDIAAQPFAEENARQLNDTLIEAERDLLLPQGLPKRPWFRHAIYAPADLKGYAASVIPGVNEAIENGDLATATQQVEQLTYVLQRAAARLESYRPAIMSAKK
jgi:N-acetylated-alpha-linked acidic dipeptidase